MMKGKPMPQDKDDPRIEDEYNREEVARWADFLIRTAIAIEGRDRKRHLLFFSNCIAAAYHLFSITPAEQFITDFLTCVNNQMSTFDETVIREYDKLADEVKPTGEIKTLVDLMKTMEQHTTLPEIKNRTLMPVMAIAHLAIVGEPRDVLVGIGIALAFTMQDNFSVENDFRDFSIHFMDKVTDVAFGVVIKRALEIYKRREK